MAGHTILIDLFGFLGKPNLKTLQEFCKGLAVLVLTFVWLNTVLPDHTLLGDQLICSACLCSAQHLSGLLSMQVCVHYRVRGVWAGTPGPWLLDTRQHSAAVEQQSSTAAHTDQGIAGQEGAGPGDSAAGKGEEGEQAGEQQPVSIDTGNAWG